MSERIRIGDHVTICPRGKRRTYTAEYWKEGTHHRVSLKTRNQKVAKDRGRAIDLEIAEGIFPTRRKKQLKISLADSIAEFIDYQRDEGCRRKTIVKQEGILLRKFAPFATAQGVRHVCDASLRLIDKYRSGQRAKLSDKSMHNEGVIIKYFLGW